MTIEQTSVSFDLIIEECRKVYTSKLKDYGTSWRILRLPALTDQIYIKANRIRSLQETKVRKIDEGIRPEFIGIINYCVIALIQMSLSDNSDLNLTNEDATSKYDQLIAETKSLMINKNHDYGEAWRSMRVSSMVDIILMKLLRVKQIEDHNGEVNVSEGIDASYFDIINYSVFALILMNEKETEVNPS